MPLSITSSNQKFNQQHITELKNFFQKASKTGLEIGITVDFIQTTRIKSKKLQKLIANNDAIQIHPYTYECIYLSIIPLHLKYDYVHNLKTYHIDLTCSDLKKLASDEYILEILTNELELKKNFFGYSPIISNLCPKITHDIYQLGLVNKTPVQQLTYEKDILSIIRAILFYGTT